MTDNQVLLYSLVDAPSPPDWLIKHAYEMCNGGALGPTVINNHGNDFINRSLYKDNKVYVNSFNHVTLLNQESHKWAFENVTKSVTDIRVTSTMPGREKNGPHCDRNRNYTLIYLLETGGADHRTTFYKELGQNDVVRPWGTHVDEYENLRELASFKLIVNRWNFVQGIVLHGVENIPDGRFSIQISFNLELDQMPKDIKLENPVYINT